MKPRVASNHDLSALTSCMSPVHPPKVYVEPSFVKRVAEAAVEELVRRYVNILLAGVPQVSDGLHARVSGCMKTFVSPR